MKLRTLHPWNVSIDEAKALQRSLAPKVSFISAVTNDVKHIAGVDISGADDHGKVQAAAVGLSFPQLDVEEIRTAQGDPGIPYIPGLLSFRETPVLADAFEMLDLTPDLIFVDGHGVAHPRRFGIACHIGLLTDTPTIACGKSILTGKHGPLGEEAGSQAELVDKGEVIGVALRTRLGATPVYVNVGHKIDLPPAAKWALDTCRGRRLPEPTRLAHQAAGGHLKVNLQKSLFTA